jgi:hypothetical protein
VVPSIQATDSANGSKTGHLSVVLDGGMLVVQRMGDVAASDIQLTPVWRAGRLLWQESLATIRRRPKKPCLLSLSVPAF